MRPGLRSLLSRILPGRHSVRTRLMLWNMLTLALLMLLLGLVTRTLVRSLMIASVDRELMRRTQRIAGHGRRPPMPFGAGMAPQRGEHRDWPGPPPGSDPPPDWPGPPPEENAGRQGAGADGRPGNAREDPGLAAMGGVPAGGQKGAGASSGSTGERGPVSGGVGGRAGSPGGAGERSRPPEPQGGRREGIAGVPAGPLRQDGGQPRDDRPPAFRILNLKGEVQAPAGQSEALDAPAAARAAGGERAVFTTIILDGEPTRVLSRVFPDRGPAEGIVQEGYALTEVNRALAGLGRALLALVPVALLFAAMGGAFLTRRVLHPVSEMAQAAARIGAEDLSERLPVAGKDEFGELGTTFNDMLQRLETAFREEEAMVEQQRRFTADASHELRTPLAVIQANADLCLLGGLPPEEHRKSLSDIRAAATSMTALVLDLLLLARSDAGRPSRDPILLSVSDVLEQAAGQVAHNGGAPVRLSCPDEAVCVLGNEDELVRLFANLLENALRHTPPEGSVTLSAERRDREAHVAVSDTGDGIAPEHLPHLGERFYRVDASRSRPSGGTGLGLSICKSIVETHRGRLAFESEVGAGTTVHVYLPVASEPDEVPEAGRAPQGVTTRS